MLCNLAYETIGKAINKFGLKCVGSIDFSASKIYYLWFCGINVDGDIRIVTGEFHAISIGMGWGYDEKNAKEHVKLLPTIIHNLEIKLVTVKGYLGLVGISLNTNEKKISSDTREKKNGFCRINSSTIEGNLEFFNQDNFDSFYNERRKVLNNNSKKNDENSKSKNDKVASLEEYDLNEYKTKINDGLEIQGTKIGGYLDLRNVDVKRKINLSDTEVNFDLNINYLSEGFHISKIVTTSCAELEMKKMDVEGDIKLLGLKIFKTEEFNGNLKATGTNVRGDILFLEAERKSNEALPVTSSGKAGKTDNKGLQNYSEIEGDIILTGVCADYIVIEQRNFKNFNKDDNRKRLYLDKARINKLQIITPTPGLDLSDIKVNRWEFGKVESASEYIKILQRMEPFDKSVYVNIERMLRNSSKDKEANEIFKAMQKTSLRTEKAEIYS